MAFTSLNPKVVGDAIKKDDWDNTKDNFDDHEGRITGVESSISKVIVFDSEVSAPSSAQSLTGITHFRALQAFTVTAVQVEIFEKGAISSGILSLDVKKNTTPDDTGMVSITTTEASIDFSTASDYDTDLADLDITQQDILVDEVLRVDITSKPASLGRFRILVYGEI